MKTALPGLTSQPPISQYTWMDLPTWKTYHDDMVGATVRRTSGSLPPVIRRAARNHSVGGFLAWNKTQDHEGGTFIMLADQAPHEERQTLRNAGWRISCGLTYALSRVGRHYLEPDHRVRSSAGDTWHVWLLPNDEYVGR